MEDRLQKIMAHAGVGSRRACEEIIKQGRVRVNGQIATLGQKVNPERDRILVDNQPLGPLEKKRYLIVNKPMGYISSVKDQFGRKDIQDLVPSIEERVYPVGRLDYESEGLLFLTNDGALANRVMHPRYGLTKTYRVQVKGEITKEAIHLLQQGVHLEDGITAPAQVKLLESKRVYSLILITLREGRNRQVRRMCEMVGYPVQHLLRTAIGPLSLDNLATGHFRFLSYEEVQALQRAVDSCG